MNLLVNEKNSSNVKDSNLPNSNLSASLIARKISKKNTTVAGNILRAESGISVSNLKYSAK
jgi:hypothetical protein